MSIELKNIIKSYGKQKALNGINITLKPGEITGFIGPNGAGKTTTMKIITGLLQPDSGTVKVFGNDVTERTIETKKHLGYLPENNPLYTDMYVKEYLAYVSKIYCLGKATSEKVNNIIERTGLLKEQHKKIAELSKGYKQRVGLAQALIHDPEILILDEPTTGLDPNQLEEIRSLIKELGKDKIVILSTHIMQEVEAICDRIIIINKGEITADAQSKELINKSNKDNIYISVEFTKSIDEERLRNIDEVKEIERITSTHYKVCCLKDIRKKIFDFAVETDSPIIELRVIDNSLETVFKKLTQ